MGKLTALAVLVSTTAAASAWAAPSEARGPDEALADAVFTSSFNAASSRAAIPRDPIVDQTAQLGAGGLLAPPPFEPGSAVAHPFQPAGYLPGSGPARWSSATLSAPASGGSVSTVRLALGEARDGPTALAVGGPSHAQAFDLTYTRGWPGAWRSRLGGYELAVTPHAGVGVSSGGGSAEAGAMLSVEARPDSATDMRSKAMGARDGADFAGAGRWYVFMAASGKAVGLNMTQNSGDTNGAGWSVDRASALIGDGQLGVGWRKGAVQAAFGYVHREIKVDNLPRNLAAGGGGADSMAAFSLSIRPRW